MSGLWSLAAAAAAAAALQRWSVHLALWAVLVHLGSAVLSAAAETAVESSSSEDKPPFACSHFIERGIGVIQRGNAPEEAVAIFQEGLEYYPHEASLWNNYAIAQALVSEDNYCEVEAAASIALRLGHTESSNLLDSMQSMIKMSVEGVEPSCPHHYVVSKLEAVMKLRKKASLAQGRGSIAADEYLAAIKEACTAYTIVVTLDEEEINQAALTATTLHKLATIFDVCGLVAIQNIFPESLIDEAALVQVEHYYETAAEGESALESSGRQKNQQVDTKRRGEELRREVVCPLTLPFTNLTSSPLVLRAAQHILQSSDIELDTFSYIQSEAGSSDQAWHTDMSPIIDEGRNEGSILLPPYGLVTIVPFIDVDVMNGSTEFVPGSNLPPTAIEGGDASFWHDPTTGRSNPDAAKMSLELPKGSAVFFDIRTTHRGRENKSPAARPILYASYFREWFIDRVNFEGRQSQWWRNLGQEEEKEDTMHKSNSKVSSDRLKKLYSRVDSRRYTKILEDMLIERGVDISDL